MTFKQYIVEKTDLETSLINKLGREVVDASNGYILPPEKDFTAHQLSKKGFRIQGAEEVKTEPFQVTPTLKNIADTIGATFDIIPPKGANARSGRFVTYLFTKNDITVPIVITNTKGNVGLTFESNVGKSFKSQLENKQLKACNLKFHSIAKRYKFKARCDFSDQSYNRNLRLYNYKFADGMTRTQNLRVFATLVNLQNQDD